MSRTKNVLLRKKWKQITSLFDHIIGKVIDKFGLTTSMEGPHPSRITSKNQEFFRCTCLYKIVENDMRSDTISMYVEGGFE